MVCGAAAAANAIKGAGTISAAAHTRHSWTPPFFAGDPPIKTSCSCRKREGGTWHKNKRIRP